MNILISIFVFISVSLIVYNIVDFIRIYRAISVNKITIQRAQKFQISQILLNFLKPLVVNILDSPSPIIKNYKEKTEPLLKLSKIEQIDLEKFSTIQILSGFVSVLFFSIVFDVNLFLIPVYAIAGFIIPVFWLKTKINQKNKLIFRTLPDVMDTMTLCMKAGLDFNAALNKYMEKGQRGPLYDELCLVQKEMQIGKNRIEALQSMVDRTKHPALNNVVSVIIQSLQLGSSLAPVLKSQSEQLRTERFQLAEKLAHEAPTKMLFPLVFFIFPTVFIILFGPIILSFINK